MQEQNAKIKKAVTDLVLSKIQNRAELTAANRKMAKELGVKMLTSAELIKVYRELLGKKIIERNADFERLLRKRSVRTLSGIAPVAVLTKPYPCPGKCAYCPTEKDVPQSYLSNEPAVMRAIRCGYDPYVQVQDRLRALIANGHEPTKIELIVIGGTWSHLPKKYKYWYIANCFKAANDLKTPPQPSPIREEGDSRKIITAETRKVLSIKKTKVNLETLLLEQRRNEKAKYKIIGLTLETRPDYINEKELHEMREFGCTRVELGVQALDDEILKLNKRGHGVKEVADATCLLKQFGFKVTYHIMPGLPGSTPEKDFKMFSLLFSDKRFQPDQIKFYPTVVTKGSLLYRWWKQGKYIPYTEEVLRKLIIKCKKVIPEYVRVIRLIRDIPGESIVAGNVITNLRQIMQKEGMTCRCIRCRECQREEKIDFKKAVLDIKEYESADGVELFLQYLSENTGNLLGFCRLRLPNDKAKSAMIRELHVYGELTSIGDEAQVQHSGLGRRLMAEAESITRKKGFKEISVISGVGVRPYYRFLKYKLKNTYMIKRLK